MLNAKIYAPLNARDKMPLEVTPIYFKLQRYETASAAAPAAPGASTTQPGTGAACQRSARTNGGTGGWRSSGSSSTGGQRRSGDEQPDSGSFKPATGYGPAITYC